MKKLLSSFLVLSLSLNAYAGDKGSENKENTGSNESGTERVCLISNSSIEAFKESLRKCKRGDVMAIGGLKQLGMLSYCDFTKTILLVNGTPLACVYTGFERQEIPIVK